MKDHLRNHVRGGATPSVCCTLLGGVNLHTQSNSHENSSLISNQPVSIGSRKSLFKPSALCLATLAAVLLTTNPPPTKAATLTCSSAYGWVCEINQAADYEDDSIYVNYSIQASHESSLMESLTIEMTKGSSFTIYLDEESGEPAVADYPRRTMAVFAAIDGVVLNLTASADVETGQYPLIEISTSGKFYGYEHEVDKPSVQSTNYAITAEKGGIVNIDGINLNLNGVVEGIWAGRISVDDANAGVVNISNNDYIYMTVDQGNIQHHGIVTYYGGEVNITNSNEVKILISGETSDVEMESDVISVYSAGLYQLGGGKINITDVGTLSITVNTQEKIDEEKPLTYNTQNYGVYALGQGYYTTSAYWTDSTYTGLKFLAMGNWWDGDIVLNGRDSGSSELIVNVEGGYDGNVGILSHAHEMNASVTVANFDNITVNVGASTGKQDYGIYATSNSWLYYGNIYFTKLKGLIDGGENILEIIEKANEDGTRLCDVLGVNLKATIDIEANEDISITAPTGIGSLVKQFDSVTNIRAGDSIVVDSTDVAVGSRSMYTGKAETYLSAAVITLKNADYGIQSVTSYTTPVYTEGDFDFVIPDGDDGNYSKYYYTYNSGEKIRKWFYDPSDPNANNGWVIEYLDIVAPGVEFDENRADEFVNIISVNATDTLTITSDKFVAAAYADSTAIEYADTSDGYKSGRNQININTADGAGTTVLTGAVWSANESEINIGLNDDKSSWTGFAQDNRGVADDGSSKYAKAGAINVTAKSGATWNVRPIDLELDGSDAATASKSYLTSWTSTGSSTIDLRLDKYTGTAYTYSYQAVDIGTLSGTGTTFKVNTNISDTVRGEGQATDQAIIHSGDGAHYIFVNPSGGGESVNEQADFLILHLEEDDATSVRISDSDIQTLADSGLSFSLVDSDGNSIDSVGVEQGLYYYKLATRDAVDPENYGGTTGQGTEWYLVRVATADTDTGPGPADCPSCTCPTCPETPAGKTVTALAGTGAKMAMYRAQLDDLRKRLGEVRYGAQDGLWARGITEKDRVAGTSVYGFTQRWYGLNFGVDHQVIKDEDKMWLLGGNLKYGYGSQKVKDSGKGGLHEYGLNLYATYANQYGCYTDIVLTLDKYKQSATAKTDQAGMAGGDYNTWGWGASIEVGKMFSSTQNDENWGPWHNHWWIEPQAQLSYYWVKGKSWNMTAAGWSDKMTVDQANGQSLIGRLGVVIGKQWSYGGSNKVDKRYAQVYVKGGVRHEFLGKQDVVVDKVLFNQKLQGTTGYYGLGVDWNLAKQVKAYAQVERESGHKYKKDYQASVGVKWEF